RTFEDWLRDQEDRFSLWGPYQIYYEGFRQYGYHGESIFEHEESE
ncbi:MAG: hypothetical protein GXX91_11225, partial [Verrucomicrobiaceae bacterium]|nr:hypothetical protein [Verrucomicrobiaceae bacterium]